MSGVKSNILFLKKVERTLRRHKVSSARHEAETLVRHFGRVDRLDFFTGQKRVSPRSKRQVEAALKVRARGVPLGHILRRADFYGRTFAVNRHTLIPRHETELLVEKALEILKTSFGRQTRPKILDVGTGSGCIAVSLTIERPDCRMTALDISPEALKVAARNVHAYGLSRKVRLLRSDLFGVFGEDKKGHWDMIVSNLPYVPSRSLARLSCEVRHEPRLALDGGAAGLDLIFSFLEQAPFYLKSGGWLLLEIGYGQKEPITKKLVEGSFKNFEFIKDLAGIPRILSVQKSG